MGTPFADMKAHVQASLGDDCSRPESRVALVAPWSTIELDKWKEDAGGEDSGVKIEELWRYGRHFNLDDLDFAREGLWSTLRRVVGRRGLVVWGVRRGCAGGELGAGAGHRAGLGGDW